MNLKWIHKFLVSNPIAIYLSIALILFLRFIAGCDWHDPVLWLSLCLQVSTSFLLLRLNHIFSIVKSKTLLPAIFYLIFTSSNPAFYTCWEESLAALLVLFCLFPLFHSYQRPDSQPGTFNIALLLTTASFFQPSLILLLPFFLYGFYRFHSLNLKTFFAFLIGLATPFLFFFSWCVFRNDMQLFLDCLSNYKQLIDIQLIQLGTKDWIITGFILLLYNIIGYKSLMYGISEKVRTVVFLNYLFVFSVFLFILLIIQNARIVQWALVIYVPVSIVLAHYFTLTQKKTSNWLLIITLTIFLGMYFISF